MNKEPIRTNDSVAPFGIPTFEQVWRALDKTMKRIDMVEERLNRLENVDMRSDKLEDNTGKKEEPAVKVEKKSVEKKLGQRAEPIIQPKLSAIAASKASKEGE